MNRLDDYLVRAHQADLLRAARRPDRCAGIRHTRFRRSRRTS